MTFPRSHFQGTHDSEVDPSEITHVNDVAPDPQIIIWILTLALEDALISYVNMDDRENGASSCRPQGRLRWIKEHQIDIYAEVSQGLQDALHVGETNAENVGKRTILSSSFNGGRRDMIQHYEDGMAIVLNGGKLDIFLTVTCNPS
ncbi:uncharacterized protein LOC127129991 [Lathyrus oleraceus]|uniref:uncharacterized protein LOC127129991 n=1 Tax=Pisum sativum TaxID=3888 RepID=UPI0021CEEC0D|nr:uncharacterized protein LOC127129991 [Pisum sativum]